MEKIWGCETGLIKSDMGNSELKKKILKKFPDAVELDRLPEQYESYIHGNGYVLDSELQVSNETEQNRVLEHTTEKSGFIKKTIKEKEDWAKERLNETNLDNASKIALGKIFRRLIAFTD